MAALAANQVMQLKPGETDLALLRSVYFQGTPLALPEEAKAAVDRCSDAVADLLNTDKVVYGVNTGFGLLANTRIPRSRLAELQRNLVLSHSCGVGEPLAPGVVRLILVLKAASLAQGYSGVRYAVIDHLMGLYKAGVLPCIPAKGSVGASGDLAPLAHLTGVLIGEGAACVDGRTLEAPEALQSAGLGVLELGPKEGLALLNGTQVSTALALAALFEAENLFAGAVVAGAMSVDGLKGSTQPFDARIHRLRRQPGQIAVAERYLALLEGSEIRSSHLDCEKVQDPYSLRCQPQVMGAVLDSMRHSAQVLLREANAVTDNPLLFPDEMDVLSGGNFHAEPVALAADSLAVAIAEIGALSERRTAILVDPKMSGLPAFLVEDSGLHSGFMIAQVTAAALASENKTLAHPASVDSLPTSANQEDHVSMATFAARRLMEMVHNSSTVVGIELLAAAQAIEVHAPSRTSQALQSVVRSIRDRVPHYEHDRRFAPDIDNAFELIRAGSFYPLLADVLPSGSAP